MTAPAFSLDKSHLNYLTDESGNKTGVVIPIELWSEIMGILEMKILKEKIKTAFQEVEGIEKGEISEITLKAFLDDL